MPIYQLDEIQPQFSDRDSVWLAPDATLIGRIRLGRDVGVWFGCVLRGDNELIDIGDGRRVACIRSEELDIGDGTNLQEQVIMHTDLGFPLTVGKGCTIGHRALLHGCTIGDNSLVGMGAIVLNGAKIGNNCLVGAGALVTEGKEFPDGSLIVGAPAKAVRTLDDKAIQGLRASAELYVANGRRFRKGLAAI